MLAVLVVAAWVISGPIFQWSDTWQLVINTGTTIVTFLMVRDAVAVQFKLDELLRVTPGAHDDGVPDIDELVDKK